MTEEGSEDREIHRSLRIFCYTPIHSRNKMVAESLTVLICFTVSMKYNNSQDGCLPYGYISCLQRRLDSIQPSLCNVYVFWFENNVNPFQIWKGMLECGTAGVEAIITDLLALGISFSLSLSPILENRRKFT